MNSLTHPSLADQLNRSSLGIIDTSNAIVPQLLAPRLNSNTKIGVIKELVDLLCQAGYVHDGLLFLQSVLARENLQSTIIDQRIAMPHARSQAVSHLGMALGLAPEALDFPSGDERGQINVVCLVAAPVHTPGLHLDLMGFLANRFATPGLVDTMLQAATHMDIYQLLEPTSNQAHLV
jgi:PTS system fructose-specific IIC component